MKILCQRDRGKRLVDKLITFCHDRFAVQRGKDSFTGVMLGVDRLFGI